MESEFGVWLLRQRRATRTIMAYSRSLERLSAWLKEHRRGTIRSLKWKTLRDYAETLPYTYASRVALQTAIKNYWRFLGRSDCPAWAVPCPKAPRRYSRRMSDDELHRVFDAAKSLGPRVYACCVIAYYTGIRREDIATLRWSQFTKDGRLHVVGKGGVERYIPATRPEIAEALAALPVEGEYVFRGRWGGHVCAGSVNKWVTMVGDLSGVDVHPHRFRHTALSNGYRRTKDLVAVQAFAGHAKISTTRDYISCEWEEVEAVAAAL